MRIFLLLALLVISACTIIEENHGANLRQLPFDKITPGTAQADVTKILGSPSTKSTYGQETWYYINNNQERRIFEEDKMLSQDAIAILFDNTGKVESVKPYSAADAKNFPIVKETTPTAGHSLTFMEQLLGNVGKFNPKK